MSAAHPPGEILLQRVGGGYRFVHKTLQDYLAQAYEASAGNR